ncbi:ead/Ea22-like family protein [Edwardsiella piscicida]|uniref:ead/Ea22-like family protein n=1 Tax=Edwardsiella piscicida TaxID=1263550 RepID=UPI00222745F2|nr:ead/Ea22-like family protein [Edwardsiella piscicida]UCQ43014.1 ead/Ea22-like family protein [Edwardsiella piscicida]
MAVMAAFGVMMNKIDKQALRSVAENATAGEWCTDSHLGVIADAGLNANYYIASCSGPEHRANARYIAAANPATMLALLDENEALEKRVVELAEEIANLKAKALYWDADNTESSYEDPEDIASALDLNPGDHFYVQVAYLDKDREYIVNDDGSVSCTQLVNSCAAGASKGE